MNLVPRHVNLSAEQYSKVEFFIEKKEFTEKKPLYIITSAPNCEGDVLYITTDRTKARRKCFTKVKKKRRAFYTAFNYSNSLPFHIIEELNKELNK